MNQILTLNLEKEMNGRIYRLALPVGVTWAEALDVIKEFGEMTVQLAEQAAKQAEAATDKSMESEAEPIDVTAEQQG